MPEWRTVPTAEIEQAVRSRMPAARNVRIRKRARLRPTMGATGSYFERVTLEVDGRRLPAIFKMGAMPAGPPVREALFFDRYRDRVPMPTAECYAVGPPQQGGDTWVLMSRLPRGKRLSEWSIEDSRAALRNLARLHAAYLGEPPPGLPRPMTAQLEDSLSFLPEGVYRLREVFDAYPGLPRFAGEPALDRLLALAFRPHIFREAFTRSRETLLHGDYHRGNIIARDGQEQAAFDWQFVCAGPPAYDLAVFWHYLGIVNKPFLFRAIDRVGLQERCMTWQECCNVYAAELRQLRPDADIAAILSCSDQALCWEVIRQVTYMAAAMTDTHGAIFRFVYRDHRAIGGWITRILGIDLLWQTYAMLFDDFEQRAARLLERG